MTEVRRNDELSRWEAVVDGHVVGFAPAVVRGDVVEIPHTEVDREYGGQGIAGDIVRRALDDISADGQQVAPTCPYVATWIRRHPEYAPLVAGSLGES